MTQAHAILSASGSKVWITCTPAARLQQQFPEDDSEFSSEGTFGHELFAHRVSAYIGRCTLDEASFHGNKYWSQELSDSVQEAVDRTIERIEAARAACSDAVILIEQRLDFSRWVPEGFGTVDLVIITDTYIEVIDLKMGSGVYVAAWGNTQFRLYALGGLHVYGDLYDAEKVRCTVLQPRLNNYGSEELTVPELLEWAKEVVVPAATLAWEGKGEFVPGTHCTEGFCSARFTCAARAKANQALVQQDFAMLDPALLTNDQIAMVLAKADQAISWLKDVQNYALKQAERGHTFDGFKLVEGRSVRKYTSQDAVAAALTAAGIPEAVIYERSLLGISAMEKAIGKKKFTELLSTLVEKPAGKPTLVPVSDKREALDPMAAAISDFSKPVSE